MIDTTKQGTGGSLSIEEMKQNETIDVGMAHLLELKENDLHGNDA